MLQAILWNVLVDRIKVAFGDMSALKDGIIEQIFLSVWPSEDGVGVSCRLPRQIPLTFVSVSGYGLCRFSRQRIGHRRITWYYYIHRASFDDVATCV